MQQCSNVARGRHIVSARIGNELLHFVLTDLERRGGEAATAILSRPGQPGTDAEHILLAPDCSHIPAKKVLFCGYNILVGKTDVSGTAEGRGGEMGNILGNLLLIQHHCQVKIFDFMK